MVGSQAYRPSLSCIPTPGCPTSTSCLARVCYVTRTVYLRFSALLTRIPLNANPPGPSPQRSAAEAATLALRHRLASEPHALFAALARMLQAAQQQQQPQQQQQQQQGAGAGGGGPAGGTAAPAPPAQQQQQQQLSRLLSLVLAVLQAALDREQQQALQQRAAAGASSTSSSTEQCVLAFAQQVLVAPAVAALVPPDAQVRGTCSGQY